MSLLSPRLQLRVAQKQILTPGLVQMVTVLQLNRLELKEMITQEIVKNPVLEESTEETGEEITPEELQPLLEAEPVVDPADKQLLEAAVLSDANSLAGSTGDVAINGNLFPDAEETAAAVEPEVTGTNDPLLDAPAATDPFDEIDFGSFFDDYLDPGYKSPAAESVDKPSFETFLSSPVTLGDHLRSQLSVSVMPEAVRDAAESIIGNLDEDGYLSASLEEIATAGDHLPEHVEAALREVQSLDPAGVAARNLRECMLLQIESVKLDGQPVEFIHNPAVEGTQLSRRGNDLVAVILPETVKAGQKMELEFVYAGEVLAEAGSGLLYVGARGNWYPNRGLAMADFDLEFHYPQGWTLVATGRPAPPAAAKSAGGESSHWISERPIPVAGFNLGKYKEAKTLAGDVTVETYATPAVERDFPSARIQVIEPGPSELPPQPPRVILPSHPSPVQNEVSVGESAARAIRFYAQRFGPYPYSRLALTQMPGRDSQGWPGLVFLSSYAFLNRQDRQQLHFAPHQILLQESIPAHETAHQWWGDLVGWKSYRDQWLSEGLANYCALMMLQEKNPEGFRQIMDNYRRDLVKKNKDDMAPKDAGPVTLGARLLSSRFPEGYEAISYGRGTWLFHMLRTMLKDAATQPGAQKSGSGGDEPFVRVLRKVRQRYEGKFVSTRELLEVFAEDLPPALRYEGKASLDWFLEGWVNGTSLPRLELKGVRLTPKGAGLEVSATILQKDAPQDLVTSVPIYAVITGKQPVLLGRVFADGEESSFRIPAPAGTRKILLDPEATILTFPK